MDADLVWYWELADASCNHRIYEADQDELWTPSLLYVKECLEKMSERFEWQEEYHM